MSDNEFYRLSSMKKVWGRSKGLALHFISNVALPMIFGIIFLSGGISGAKLIRPLIAENPFPPKSSKDVQVKEESQEILLGDVHFIIAA